MQATEAGDLEGKLPGLAGEPNWAGWVFALAVAALLASAAPADAGRFDALDDPGDPSPRYRIMRSARFPARPPPRARSKDSEARTPAVPLGPLHIIVSVARQRVTLFANGRAIAQAPVSTGVPGHPTPMGIFAVISKSKWHRSNLYSAAPMPYMHRITWSGVALHAGPLPGYPASHGCIRLPEAFAVKLWGLSKLGARVIVTRDEAAPVEFAHARLLVPKKPMPPPEPKPADAPVAAAPEPIKTADMTGSLDIVAAEPAAPPVNEPPKRQGPVQVFVSRKAGKLYVRQGFAPLFEAPVTIAEPEKPFGTHVFTLMELKEAGAPARWTAVTVPSGYVRKGDDDRRSHKLSARERERQAKFVADLAAAPTAAVALDRFELPPDAADRISELLAVGSALIVSDNELSDETGIETDFIVLTQ